MCYINIYANIYIRLRYVEVSLLIFMLPPCARLRDPLYSPAHATEAQLDGLPPLYLAVSGSEVMTGQWRHVNVMRRGRIEARIDTYI